MKLAVKKIDALKRKLLFEVPAERVAHKLEEVFVQIGKQAKIKGFRPGKAPRDVLEREHGALAREEMIKDLIPEIYQEGLDQEKILPLDLPEVQDVSLKEGVLKFTAQIEIKPEIKLGEYRGVKVKRKSSKVTDAEIDKTLEHFKKSQGQDKEIAIDDQFVKGLGYPDLATFKQSLSRQMEIDKDRQNRMDVEHQLVDALLKETKVAVPQGFVNKHLEMRVRDAVKRMQEQKMPENDIKKKEDELRKALQKPIEKEVKVYLVFDKIAQQEKIEVKDGENMVAKVMEFLLKEAAWQDA